MAQREHAAAAGPSRMDWPASADEENDPTSVCMTCTEPTMHSAAARESHSKSTNVQLPSALSLQVQNSPTDTCAVLGPVADSSRCIAAKPAAGWMTPMPERWMRASDAAEVAAMPTDAQAPHWIVWPATELQTVVRAPRLAVTKQPLEGRGRRAQKFSEVCSTPFVSSGCSGIIALHQHVRYTN